MAKKSLNGLAFNFLIFQIEKAQLLACEVILRSFLLYNFFEIVFQQIVSREGVHNEQTSKF